MSPWSTRIRPTSTRRLPRSTRLPARRRSRSIQRRTTCTYSSPSAVRLRRHPPARSHRQGRTRRPRSTGSDRGCVVHRDQAVAARGLPRIGASQQGVAGLRFNHRKPFDCLEAAVAANQRCVHGEGGCGDPEVVLIRREAAALSCRMEKEEAKYTISQRR